MDLAAYEAEVLEWRAGRLERLLDPNGYLTQVGLRWLDEGTYSIGSDPGNDIVIPATAAARIGELRVATDGVLLVVEEGAAGCH
jgi:pSer/pThr/pTyr-binding forkhead associated (FHA) protein